MNHERLKAIAKDLIGNRRRFRCQITWDAWDFGCKLGIAMSGRRGRYRRRHGLAINVRRLRTRIRVKDRVAVRRMLREMDLKCSQFRK